jgi:hypothetical protein
VGELKQFSPDAVDLTIITTVVAIVKPISVVTVVVVPYPQHSINPADRATDGAAKDTADYFADRTGGTVALVGPFICASHNALSLRGKRHCNEGQGSCHYCELRSHKKFSACDCCFPAGLGPGSEHQIADLVSFEPSTFIQWSLHKIKKQLNKQQQCIYFFGPLWLKKFTIQGDRHRKSCRNASHEQMH